MPAATSHPSTSRPDSHRTETTSHPPPPPRKTRTIRRRARGRNEFASDEEFEREVGTDSESDGDDDQSSVDSSTDSDTEPVSEDILSATPSRILTPNTTQSSADAPSLNESASKPTQGSDGRRAPFFSDAGNWSEMVAEENAHGPAELPVIEFADLTGPPTDQRSKATPQRKPTKPSKRPPVQRAASAPTTTTERPSPGSEQPEDSLPEPTSDQPVASTSRQFSRTGFRRVPGQSARQAYQQRLETDPSYIPTVGEFWGHDDRLLDKDLRSLSGWWRGRWQGRGRGRGSFDRGFARGRGRGGFAGPAPALRASQSEDGLATQEKPPVQLPSAEQTWTHDGFEEMKKRDEKRREVAQQQPTARPTRGFAPLRGRSGFIAGRGRGGAGRGVVPPQPSRSTATAAAAHQSGKIWYAMKPEYPWTKHLETSLFHDSGPKPRPGSSPSYRVRLPNMEVQIVRGSPQAAQRPKPLPTSEPLGSEYGEKSFIVRLPKSTPKEKVVQPGPVSVTTTEEPHLEDVFTVRPELVPPRAPIVDIKLPSSSVTTEGPVVASTAGPSTHPAEPSVALPSPTAPVPEQPTQSPSGLVDTVLHGHQDTVAPTLLKADTPHAPEPPEVPGGRRTIPPVPPPLQTVFTPPQSSPPYSSPYGYGSPLPPGIAISQHGMAYEVATGRPVYLPAPIYTPRPLAHGMMTPPGVSFVPGHMHQHSTGSPDFLSAPHTPPLNGFIDPTGGSSIFAFPRQSSRVEIRAPSQLEAKITKSQRRPSSLRTSAAAFEPSGPSGPVHETQPSASRTEHYPSQTASEVQGDANATSEQHMDPSMYNYTAYPHAYYYPDQYGYSQYYDMSHVPRYEMYQADPHASQPVYY